MRSFLIHFVISYTITRLVARYFELRDQRELEVLWAEALELRKEARRYE